MYVITIRDPYTHDHVEAIVGPFETFDAADEHVNHLLANGLHDDSTPGIVRLVSPFDGIASNLRRDRPNLFEVDDGEEIDSLE